MQLQTGSINCATGSTQAVRWENNQVILLDQTALPEKEIYLRCSTSEELIEAIKRLVVRGAPAIGIAGAYGVVLATQEILSLAQDKISCLARLEEKLKALELSRPTAVNLKWAIERLRRTILNNPNAINAELVEQLLRAAKQIHAEDIQANKMIAEFGVGLLESGPILTICNAGELATGGIGTAFGILTHAYHFKKTQHIYACETRPVLQGLRLTAWELNRHKIPFTMICDNMAAALMRREKIGAVITGADRIAGNGDVANKIGTYSLAVLAKEHGVPFYVAAPVSTFDLSLESGNQIPIEERDTEEVLAALGKNRHDFSVPIWNPAFDVTPHEYINAIICERGVINSPNQETINTLLNRD